MPAVRSFLPVAAAGVAILLSGCGSNGSSATPTTPDCVAVRAAGTAPQSEAARSPDLTYLTDVSIQPEDCVDRVEFAFRPSTGMPGYRVAYVPADAALVEDGSGARIDVQGGAYLVVRLEPAATADITGEDLVRTYRGPRRLAPPENARFVRELVKSGDFEAVVTWVIGVDRRRPFAATVSDSRLVVEIG
jgi:hypothetical protein